MSHDKCQHSDGLKQMDGDNTGGERLGTTTTNQLPLSLGVQAALEVLALPTQKEYETLQPSQAKLSRASFGGRSGGIF